MRMCMGTKTISIMEDVYELLLARKKLHESFSQVIRRKFREKKDIMEFAGAWAHLSEAETEDMKENIRKLRRKSTQEVLKKQ